MAYLFRKKNLGKYENKVYHKNIQKKMRILRYIIVKIEKKIV